VHHIAHLLVWLTAVAGLATLVSSAVHLAHGSDVRILAGVLAATVVGELLKVTIYEARRQTLSFSLSVVVIMGAVTVDPWFAPWAAFVASLTHVVAARQRNPIKIAFNLFNLVVAAGAASFTYVVLRDINLPFGLGPLGAAGCAALVYYFLNVGLTSIMIALHAARPFLTLVRESIWFAPTSILLGLTGAFIGIAQSSLGAVGAVMFTVPVLVMRFTLAFYARRSAATIQHLDDIARHDSLTGLANRVELQEKLQERLEAATGGPFALLTMDLDRFKEINDTFGHQIGDLLLKQIGPRIASVLGAADLVVRLGGDEYAVLLKDADSEAASNVARRLIADFERTFVVDGHRLDVAASIGVAMWPDDGDDGSTLLRSADVAMYVAKRDRSGFALHASDQDQHSPERLTLIGELRHAIEADDLILHFQPKIDLRTRRVCGAEALVRWRHPERGLIPPDVFIPLAEHAGLIKPLTRWVVDSALRQSREWRARGWDITIAVNASVQDLRDAAFPDFVFGLLEHHQVPASALRVEITESAMMNDFGRTREVLDRLRSFGIGVSVDDFGTGYSSLAYLKRLPVNELKLDRAFVRNVATDREDLAIVQSTIALAHALGLSVVAEGAEDEAALDHLAALNCDQVQGYVISRPLPAEAFGAWLLGQSTGHQKAA
jgi:diguanylate cyclase (GGDEF)-like protein